MFGRVVARNDRGDDLEHEFTAALIPLLSAGLNDKAIAAELGISSATLNRRMSDLMKKTGTRTRFQLGWHVALDASFAHVHAGNSE
jgi:AraC-like DNA-binding protein